MATETPDTEPDRPPSREQAYGREPTGLGSRRMRRVGAGVLGGALLVRGLRRRSIRGLLTAAAGGWLLARALGRTEQLKRTVRSGTDLGGQVAERTRRGKPMEATRSIIVDASPEDLYELARDPDQLSTIAGEFVDVTAPDDERIRVTARAPGEREVSWEMRIVEDEPGELIRWDTPGDALVRSEGSLRFEAAPADRGTLVVLSMTVDPPGGDLGRSMLSKLDVVPEALAGTALRRFKSLAETGEIPTLRDNPSGRGRGDLL